MRLSGPIRADYGETVRIQLSLQILDTFVTQLLTGDNVLGNLQHAAVLFHSEFQMGDAGLRREINRPRAPRSVRNNS